MSAVGICDKKQYEHSGPHERIVEHGQILPPFPCINWTPSSKDFVCRAPNCFHVFSDPDQRENHEWLVHQYKHSCGGSDELPNPARKLPDTSMCTASTGVSGEGYKLKPELASPLRFEDTRTSTQQKHTQGPWLVSPPTRENPSRAIVTACSGFVLIYEAPLTRETEANAHLIAAAPDMLEALQSCLSLIEFYAAREMNAPANNQEAVRDTREKLNLYRASIAKAEGKS